MELRLVHTDALCPARYCVSSFACYYYPTLKLPPLTGVDMRAEEQLARHWRLLTLIASTPGGATLRSLADQSRVCDRTIRRDLAVMQSVGIPLLENKGENNRKYWSLSDAGKLANLCFTLEEAAALYLGRQFLEPLIGTYFHHGARSAFEKIKQNVSPAALRHLEKLAACFYCKTHGLSDYSAKGVLIDDLQCAIEDCRLTVIEYQSLRSTEPVTLYDIHPYGIAWHKHALYLIAWSQDHKAVRTFKIDRIIAIETKRLQFRRPADFDLESYLAHSFGIMRTDAPPQRTTIRFAPAVARILQEKVFHPSQHLTVQSTGHLLARYDLSSFDEFTSWLLSFGPLAEVLEPLELREKVKRMLEETLETYRITTSTGARQSRRTPK